MKLKKITARNFKGLSFELDLAAGNVLIGANFAGKSARTDAIRLLLLGYLPELGKRPGDTFRLASGREMHVSGILEDGREIWRNWELNGDSVKSTNNIEDRGGHDGLPGAELLPVMLNAETYFALSERERVNYVFTNIPLAGGALNPEGIIERLRSHLTEHKPELVEALILEVDAKIFPVSRKAVQSYLEKFVELVAERVKDEKAAAVRMEKTVQGLSQLRSADKDVGPAAEVLESQIATLTRAVTERQERKNVRAASYSSMLRDRNRRKEIDRELLRLGTEIASVPAIKERLVLARADLAAAGEKPNLEPVREALSTLKMDQTLRTHELGDANRALDKIAAQVGEISKAETCPFCGAAGDGWKALRSEQLRIDAEIQTGAASAAKILLEKIAVEILEKQKELADLTERARRRSALELEIREHEKDLAAFTPAESRIEILKEELARLLPDDVQLETDVQMIQTEINVKADEIRRLEADCKRAVARKAELGRLADAETARDAAIANREVADAALVALRQMQADLVKSAFDPLLSLANRIFGSVLKTPIAYYDGEIGTWRKNVWVGHRTFSGTEKALTYAAVQVALAAKSPFRLVILDELGRVDDLNVAKILAQIALALEERVVDQFVGIDAQRRPIYERIAAQPSTFTFVQIG